MHRLGQALLGDEQITYPWLRGVGPDRSRAFIALPSSQRATMLVPAGNRRQQAAALSRPDSVSSRTRRAGYRVLQRAIQLGAGTLMAPFAYQLNPSFPSIIDHVRSGLAVDVVYAPSTGPVRPNQKPVGRLIARRGNTVGWLKIGTVGGTATLVRHEEAMLRYLTTILPSDISIPTVRLGGPWKSVNFHITEPLERPPGQPDFDPAIRWLAELSDGTRKRDLVVASQAWQDLVERSRRCLSREELITLGGVSRWIEAQSCALGVIHGDWSPWNRQIGQHHAWVWDWERCQLDGPIGFDVIHNAVQVSLLAEPGNWHAALRNGAASLDHHASALSLSERDQHVATAWYTAELLVRYSETTLKDQTEIAAIRRQLHRELATHLPDTTLVRRAHSS